MFELLDAAFKEEVIVPNHTELAHYFFAERGIGLEKFDEYPIPYIVEVMRVHGYFKQKEKEKTKNE